MACSWRVSCPLDAPAGLEASSICPTSWMPRKPRSEFLVFPRYLGTLYPPGIQPGVVLDNYSPHRSTHDDPRVAEWATANNVELAYTPTNACWLNRIEAQFQALRTSPWTAPTMPATTSRPA